MTVQVKYRVKVSDQTREQIAKVHGHEGLAKVGEVRSFLQEFGCREAELLRDGGRKAFEQLELAR